MGAKGFEWEPREPGQAERPECGVYPCTRALRGAHRQRK